MEKRFLSPFDVAFVLGIDILDAEQLFSEPDFPIIEVRGKQYVLPHRLAEWLEEK